MNRISHPFRKWFAPFVPPREHRLPLLLAFATGVVAYGIFIFHHLLHDHAPRMPWIDVATFSNFGRWATIPIFALGYNADIPILNPLIGLVFLLFSGYFAFVLFSGKEGRAWEVYLLSSLVVAFPMNLSFFFFTFSTLFTTASILFAVLAAWSCRQGTWLGGIFGFFFLVLMWTTYQASIGVFLVLMGGFFIAALLRTSSESLLADASDPSNLLKPFIASFLALVASAGVYVISFKFFAGGIGHASSISLEALPSVWLAVGESAFKHLWLTQPDLHKTIKAVVLCVVCLAFLGSLWVCRRSWSRVLLLLVLWSCCLLATKAIFFLVEAKFSFYEYRVNAALGFFYALAFWVLFFLTRRTKLLYVLCAVVACFTLLRFVQADLVRQIVNKRGETHDLALANRMLSRIEALEGLDPSKKYQLVRIGNYPWFRRSLMTAGGRKYDASGDSHMDTGFITAHWVPHEVFNYLGSRVQLGHDDFPSLKRQEFAKQYLLKDRKPYPAESSIFLFGDTIFVYLSHFAPVEKPILPQPAISATKGFLKTSENTWRFQKQEDSKTPACWMAISKEKQTKNKTFNGSLTITSDRDLNIQALLCSHAAPYDGSSASYQVKANEPLEINLFHTFKQDTPAVKLQLNVTSEPEEPVNLKVENLRIVEYP